MSSSIDKRENTHCPHCQSPNLTYGVQGTNPSTYNPAGKMLFGFKLLAFGCIDCGFVGFYLSDQDREIMKRDHFKPES